MEEDAAPVVQGIHPGVAGECIRGGRTAGREGGRFTPVDIRVDKGVTVIVGPNMGGKTMALRTLGAIVALAQHGFFVPAARCEMPLVAFVSGVMGDGQDARAGLSTFGAEVKRVAEWFREKKGGLLLIDEIGRGTNPVEGAALSAAVTARLARSDHWAVHVTHYGEVLEVAGIRRYRTAGLREEGGNREDWTGDDWSSRMDFRLIPLAEGEGVPRQALWIAEAMGMPREIVEDARRRIAGESGNAEGSSDGREAAERRRRRKRGDGHASQGCAPCPTEKFQGFLERRFIAGGGNAWRGNSASIPGRLPGPGGRRRKSPPMWIGLSPIARRSPWSEPSCA